MSTQPAGSASETIIRDVIRDGLRSAAGGSTYELSDPLGGNRSADTEFILTSFPSRAVEYPHIVIVEAGDSGGRLDSRVDLLEHTFDVRVEVYGRSATEVFNLRDDVREWFQGEIETFRSNGWHDIEIAGSTPISHETDVNLNAWQITYSGTLYTTSP